MKGERDEKRYKVISFRFVSIIAGNGYDVACDDNAGVFLNLISGGTIATSIDNNRPVLVRADSKKTPKTFKFLWWTITYGYSYSGGHSWLIDGYYQMQRNVTVKRKILFWTITTNSTETLQCVHCNYGWNDDSDDWYLSGVYAGNLQYNIRLWCNIYPKK